MTVTDYKEEINNLVDLPEKLKSLIQSEVILLEEAQKNMRLNRCQHTYLSQNSEVVQL